MIGSEGSIGFQLSAASTSPSPTNWVPSGSSGMSVEAMASESGDSVYSKEYRRLRKLTSTIEIQRQCVSSRGWWTVIYLLLVSIHPPPVDESQE